MKKIFFLIIFTFCVFSTKNISANNSGLIENILNLEYGPLIYDLSLEELKTYNFKDKSLNNIYKKFKNYDSIIKKEIIKQYKLGNYDYNTTYGIIKNYKNFIYYLNNFFYLLSLIEENSSLKNDKEFQYSFLETYKNIDIYYKKVKYLINKK